MTDIPTQTETRDRPGASPPAAPAPRRELISIIVPCLNEEANIASLAERVHRVCLDSGIAHELIFVNDGSSDGTWEAIEAVAQAQHYVVGLDFSRNFGKDAAMMAGLDIARGDAIIFLDADHQHPPELIPELVAAWRQGGEVVDAERDVRRGQSAAAQLQARLFYWLFRRVSGLDISESVGDFRLLDRKVVDVICQMRERRRFMKGIVSWVGFRRIHVPYVQGLRGDKPERGMSFRHRLSMALNGITSFSSYPLRMWSAIGFAASGIAFLYILYRVVRAAIFGVDVPGYESILAVMLFLGGLQLITLGIIGDYIGRIYDETKGRPLYIVRHSVRGDLPPHAEP